LVDNVRELKLNEASNKAGRAAQALDNEELKAAFKIVEAQYLDALLTADEKDDLGRFRYGEAIKVVRLVARQLNIAVQNGKLAKAELTEMGREAANRR
jgi:hypothetical protein